MLQREFHWPLRVYIEDTDAGGLVYYVNYLKYFERSRTELLRHLGVAKAAILSETQLLVVRSAQVDYYSPARLDDNLIATATIIKLARTHVIFQQRLLRALEDSPSSSSADLLCQAEIKVVCVSQREQQLRPTALPPGWLQALEPYEYTEAVDAHCDSSSGAIHE